MLGPGQCGFEQARVAGARRAAVLAELLIVHSQQHLRVQPDPGCGHLASSRSTLRRRFMTSRAAVIGRDALPTVHIAALAYAGFVGNGVKS